MFRSLWSSLDYQEYADLCLTLPNVWSKFQLHPLVSNMKVNFLTAPRTSPQKIRER